MLNLAALVLAAVSAASTASTPEAPALKASAPWWEKVTVTLASDGQAKACSYQTSLKPGQPSSCEVTGSTADLAPAPGGAKDETTKITFERRFNPGVRPDSKVGAGDTLLGSQVMALAIDQAGAVKGCEIVSRSGSMTPDYGCEEAKAERFEAGAKEAAGRSLQGYMTILVYGHDEYMV